MSEELFKKLSQAVIDGEPEEAEDLATKVLAQGVDPLTSINQGLKVGMERVGELFASGEYYLPDLIIGAEAMKVALAVLEPALMAGQQRDVIARVVIGTVEGDLHDIGKTLVATMLAANGFQVTDIGVDQPASEFVAAVEETKSTLVGTSALLTTTMLQQKKIIEALKESGLRDKVKVIVGGAPVTQAWAEEIKADGFAEDAIAAVEEAKRLVAE
jgi:corrinoid protein of di/trimethylamine methyltransferase